MNSESNFFKIYLSSQLICDYLMRASYLAHLCIVAGWLNIEKMCLVHESPLNPKWLVSFPMKNHVTHKKFGFLHFRYLSNIFQIQEGVLG